MEAADYDKRTVLHIAAAEGELNCVKFLLDVCRVPLEPVDRWGYTPLDDAKKFKHIEVQEYLEGEAHTEFYKQNCKIIVSIYVIMVENLFNQTQNNTRDNYNIIIYF